MCVRLQVGVHIADVSHFIRPGNALDGEAANRGTTVYLCGRVSISPQRQTSKMKHLNLLPACWLTARPRRHFSM